MKKFILFIVVGFLAGIAGAVVGVKFALPKTTEIIQKIIPPDRSLDKYTIENLSQKNVGPSKIKIGEAINEKSPFFTSYLFTMNFDPTLSDGPTKKLSGIVNIPKKDGKFPVILMLRGYVDVKSYFPGNGTIHTAEFFAENGFITLAPDFLGYGSSDPESPNIFEARFQTYTTAMATLISIQLIEAWDHKNIFIWGHSNGGHLALTLLEITGKNYPTTLWAPVTKPFPYSILYYTDDVDDRGKFLRKELSKFEETYDTDKYSIDKFYDNIHAPIQLHQGTADDSVPDKWSDNLAKTLKEKGIDLTYFKYPAADHNLMPSWNTVVERDLEFFAKNKL